MQRAMSEAGGALSVVASGPMGHASAIRMPEGGTPCLWCTQSFAAVNQASLKELRPLMARLDTMLALAAGRLPGRQRGCTFSFPLCMHSSPLSGHDAAHAAGRLPGRQRRCVPTPSLPLAHAFPPPAVHAFLPGVMHACIPPFPSPCRACTSPPGSCMHSFPWPCMHVFPGHACIFLPCRACLSPPGHACISLPRVMHACMLPASFPGGQR